MFMTNIRLCLFSSTPDMENYNFIVKVLTGPIRDIARKAVDWGYDGLEFMPNPEQIPDPVILEDALRQAGAIMPVINTGRLYPQGMALLHEHAIVRQRSMQAFKAIIQFAGHFKAKVGLGIARGTGIPEDSLAEAVFREIADHAAQAGVVVMLEPIDPGGSGYINTMDEAVAWAERINSPGFNVMLDTYQLAESEPSIEHGIRAARGKATHIHLYDPSRWPPGVLSEGERLDWPNIGRVLREEGFQGTGSVVLAPEGDPEPAARKASAYLRRLFSAQEAV
jgi:sugar phosphate isomerase/epimerase